MHVDHGFTQCLEQLFERPPAFVPVFINCVAKPIASCARVIALGKAVGEYFKAGRRRVAFIGSGGLSHDAPLPALAAVEGAARRKLIESRLLSPDERAEREQRTLAAADQFALGNSPLAMLSPEWDQEMMRRLAHADWPFLQRLVDDDITATAGRSAHELRTWLASFSALSAFGPYEVEQSVYLPIPEWIVGYGAMRARPSAR
jgi:2,3-dihydroxyphenylpropionate 1,2-dioxygenase